MSSVPARILFLRPDTYGDLFLFEPVPRLVRSVWPHTEVAVLLREPYADVVPLLASEGVRWLTTDCDPYREGPGERPAALEALRRTVQEFAPDCVVAACAAQTWLEPAVATFLPHARQISVGAGLTDLASRVALDAVLPSDWAAIYPEKVHVDPDLPEWEKNLRLADALLGREAPRWWPVARVPGSGRERVAQILAERGLRPGEFVACAAAGTANVKIKSWPASHYGETLAWLEREKGVRALLIGHAAERETLEAVRQAAHDRGVETTLWLGQDGEMPVVAGLLAAARFYFGNDTGAQHLAAALGRPVLSIFGGGTWPRFRPMARRSCAVVQPLPCFGCAWDCYFVDAPCVRTISPASVRQALEKFLQDDADGQTMDEAGGLDPGARALIHTATPRLRFLHRDSADRLRQTGELAALLRESEADRDARLEQVRDLSRQARVLADQLQANDTEHRRQTGELAALLRESEADRDARLEQVRDLSRQARVLADQLQADDTEHRRQTGELTALLRESEADRDARLEQVRDLSRQARVLADQLQANDTEHRRQTGELAALLRESEADRADRLRQIEELAALLRESEADRADRLRQIEELTAWLRESEADRAARLDHIMELRVVMQASETQRAHLLSQIEERRADQAEPAGPADVRLINRDRDQI